MSNFLSFDQTLSLIAAVGDIRTVLISGENGIGKTALFHRLKQLPQFADHIAVDPIDCTQLSDGSVWMPEIDSEKGVSRELPNERFGVSHFNQRGINGSKPVLVFLDEIAKAPQYIKNALAPIMYERRNGQYHFPEGSIVFAATNLGIEGLGDNIQAHLRNRLLPIKMRKPTAKEWIDNFAIPRKLNPTLIAWVSQYPLVLDSFLDYEKGGKYEGKNLSKENAYIFNPKAVQDAYVSPRSLHAASDILNRCEGVVDDDTLEAALEAAMGSVARASIASFVRFGRDICSYERVIADPEKAPLSDNPTAQLVQVFQFITRVADRDQADKVTQYVMRMREEMQSVFTSNVADSGKAGMFVTVPTFTQMMAKHRIYLTK